METLMLPSHTLPISRSFLKFPAHHCFSTFCSASSVSHNSGWSVTYLDSLVLSLCIRAHSTSFAFLTPNLTRRCTHPCSVVCCTYYVLNTFGTFSWEICEQVMTPDHQHFLLSLWLIICKSTHTWPVQLHLTYHPETLHTLWLRKIQETSDPMHLNQTTDVSCFHSKARGSSNHWGSSRTSLYLSDLGEQHKHTCMCPIHPGPTTYLL